MTTSFETSTHHVGGFTIHATWYHGDIAVTFSDGRGIRAVEDFTARDSAIYDLPMLRSYCEARMAQWKFHKWQRV